MAPVVPVVNPILVALPSQIAWDEGVVITLDVGFTVTSKLNGVPGQSVGVGPVGVMTYLTIPGEVPVLTNVWLIRVPQPEEQSLKPEIVPPAGEVSTDDVQVKVVPVVADVMV